MLNHIKFLISGGLRKNPTQANELINDQVFSTLKSIDGILKKDSLMEKIEKERLQIQEEQELFLKKYEDGKFNDDLDLAEKTIDKLSDKYDELNLKLEELQILRNDIKSFDNKTEQKEKEFKNELKEHKERSYYELKENY